MFSILGRIASGLTTFSDVRRVVIIVTVTAIIGAVLGALLMAKLLDMFAH